MGRGSAPSFSNHGRWYQDRCSILTRGLQYGGQRRIVALRSDDRAGIEDDPHRAKRASRRAVSSGSTDPWSFSNEATYAARFWSTSSRAKARPTKRENSRLPTFARMAAV